MRAIWSGAINFGLVNIPVKVYSATQQNRLDLDMLDKTDLAPIRYARISTSTEKEIPFEEIVKGYKFEGEYVVVDKEDFEKVAPEKSKTIDIVNFIDASEIESMYYEKPYFLEPDKNAARPYALLREALKKSKKVGIAIFVFRNKQHIGVIKPSGNALILNQIRYSDELRNTEELNLPGEQTVKGKEIEMALALIEQTTSDFNPGDYKDEYTEELLKLIEQKAKGKPLKIPKTKSVKATKPDQLMEMLKESLKKRKQSRTEMPKKDRKIR
jgi:DNA end-binding protein Ku